MSNKKKISSNRCPKCKKKLSKCTCQQTALQTQKKWLAIAVIIGVIFTICIIVFWPADQNTPSPNKTSQTADNPINEPVIQQKLRESYAYHKKMLAEHQEFTDDWWLTDNPFISADFKLIKVKDLEKILAYKEKIKQLMQKYKDTNDNTREIVDKYQDIQIFVSIGDKIVSIPDETYKPEEKNYLNIAFIPQKHYNPAIDLAYSSFMPEFKTVVFAAIDYKSEALWAGLLFHEMTHALNYEKGLTSYKTMNITMINDEIKAYKAQTQVMNIATSGQYLKILDEIINNVSSEIAGIDKAALATITYQNIQDIVITLNQQNAGPEEIKYMFHILEMGLTFRYLDSIDAPPSTKQKYYSWYISNFYSK